MRQHRNIAVGLLAACVLCAPLNARSNESRYDTFIPYVPTPRFIVERMLEIAEVGKDDLVLDLGSGDGRIVIEAATRYGARGRGVEIDPRLVAEAHENAKRAGVSDRTAFVAQDMFVAPIADATVLTLYVLTASNLELRPRILAEMRPGSRVVSHQFGMGAWLADKHERHGDIEIYMWHVPAAVGGTWRIVEGKQEFLVEIEQEFQEIAGTARRGSRTGRIRQARLRGTEIDFALDFGDENPVLFRGRVDGNTIRPRDPSEKRDWEANRLAPPRETAK